MTNTISRMNRKGIISFAILGYTALALIALYLILLLPIPGFSFARSIINYFIAIGSWIILQGALIYGYWKLGTFIAKTATLKNFIATWEQKITRMVS